ncbi:MAG: hypothetical protein RSB74_06225 [Kiritimatiellia bacterium]
MFRNFSFCVLVLFVCISSIHAGWFSGPDKDVELAEHVATVLREPRHMIVQAQAATDKGDTEEAIRLFRQAQTQLEAIEKEEDTSGSAFAALRLTKFHCISMLDDLVLHRAEVQNNRLAVTETSELAAKLAAERALLVAQATNSIKRLEPPKAPTFSTQLVTMRAQADKLQLAWVSSNQAFEKAKANARTAREAFTVAARENTRADAALLVAQSAVKQKDVTDENIALLPALTSEDQAALEKLAQAKEDAKKAVETLSKAKTSVASAEALVRTTEAESTLAQQNLSEALARVETLKKAVAMEEAKEKTRQAEEQKRMEVAELQRKQVAAEAEAKAREEAARVKSLKAESEKKRIEEAEKVKAIKKEVTWCEELWRVKRIEQLEKRLSTNLVDYPDTAEFFVLLAKLRLIQGRAEDALELVSMVSAKGNLGLQTQMIASGAYLSDNHPMDAMKVLEQAIKMHSKAPAPYFNMAILLLKLPEMDKDHQLAEKYYRLSVELGGKRSDFIEHALNME